VSRAGLPEAFAITSRTGWWTTCLGVLPAAERARGRFHVYDTSVPAVLEAAGLAGAVWPDGDPGIPVRSLWGSPLMPDRIWHACSEVLPQLLPAARAAATQRLLGPLQDAGALPAPIYCAA